MQVRKATPDDAAAIARAHTRTWQSSYTHIFPSDALAQLSEEGRAARWSEILSSEPPAERTFVAERDGEVVGFVSIGAARAEAPDVGELRAIYVLPESSGAGVGRALMAEALAHLREKEFREAILWVIEDNPRTRRFYELAGWRADGGLMEDEWLGTTVREVRYRIVLVAREDS